MLSYYDLKAMLMSLTIGISVVAAMLACRWGEHRSQQQDSSPPVATAAHEAAPEMSLEEIVMTAPSFDGAEMKIFMAETGR